MEDSQVNNILDQNLFTFEVGNHNQQNVIWVAFEKDLKLIKILKIASKPRWSSSQKSWYLLDNKFNREICNLPKKYMGKDALLKISASNLSEFEKFHNFLILKGFSQNTIRTYTVEFAQLLYTIKDFPVQNLNAEKLQSYFLYCHKILNLSENTIHSRMNAVKFYFEKVLHREKLFFDIPRPKKPQLLPKALNREEISKIIASTDNPKHQLILQLCYGMGLRVSEIVNIKIEHIDSITMTVLIERGKGKKDRLVNLPQSILQDLRWYYKSFLPKEFLFEGQYGGKYSIRSAQSVFKIAMKKCGITKNVGIHSLRHSYATHLLEFGTDISLIQKLLGHSDIKTTLNYTHIANHTLAKVHSPLDYLK